MIKSQTFIATCISKGIDFFTGVPDSLLKNLCAYLTDNFVDKHIIAANEGGAIALAAGRYLATGKPAVVYMQNSGQGNTINPLTSLADPDVYSIPMLLVVGWRGEPGKKDEPQHVKQGKVTISLYETIGIPTYILPDSEDDAISLLNTAINESITNSRPVSVVVRKGLFEDYKLQNKKPDIACVSREDIIEQILDSIPNDAIIVSTTGMISRELYELRVKRNEGHQNDFLTVGSMGHASMIALGIAREKTNRFVLCLDGDGASIMQMGNMAIVAQSGCVNLRHIVLNNAAHDSVGGQPTVGGDISFSAIAEALGYKVVNSIDAMLTHSNNSPIFLELKVAKGARSDLGRPKESPQENKKLFMQTLSQE